jgi:uncharacterized protein
MGLETIGVVILAFLAALTQSLSGFGFSLFIVPPLALLVGPREAVVLANTLGILMNIVVVQRTHRHADWRLGSIILVGAAAGMPLGLLLLVFVDPRILQVVIAVTVILSTVFVWRGTRFRRVGRPQDFAAGLVSGVLNTSTSMSGPPVVLYMQGRGVEPNRFRATLGAFFLASNLIAIALFFSAGRLTLEILLMTLVALPLVIAGYLVGNRVYMHLDLIRFRQVVIGVLIGSGVIALASALF